MWSGIWEFFLCNRTECSSIGISLSENEVQIAQRIAIKNGLHNRCTFIFQNFDQLIEDKFDLILASGSIKHSIDLPKTIDNLVQSLLPGGKLIIVEDFFIKKDSSYWTKTLLREWCLKSPYTIEEYLKKLEFYPNLEMKLHDLTLFLIHKKQLNSIFNL